MKRATLLIYDNENGHDGSIPPSITKIRESTKTPRIDAETRRQKKTIQTNRSIAFIKSDWTKDAIQIEADDNDLDNYFRFKLAPHESRHGRYDAAFTLKVRTVTAAGT